MSDLIERLREGVHGKSVTLTDGLLNSRLHEAADQLEAQQAEIARLREVLRSIAERPGEGVEYSPGHGDEVCSEARHMELIARKALEKEP